MNAVPPTLTVDALDELPEGGHLWILEDVVGAPLRFRLRSTGMIQFGDADRMYDHPEELPAQYRHAVRSIRTALDREALRAAVDDVESIVFVGEAMQYRGLDYDWERTPSFLGREIWAADTGQFRPPDAVDRIFRRLGLDPINAVDQEVRARDFQAETYSVPASAWYDGPAAGVVIRDKQGYRARRSHPDLQEPKPTVPSESTAAELAARYGSQRRLETHSDRLTAQAQSVTVETLSERALEAGLRELHPRTFGWGGFDRKAFRSELATLVARFLDEQ